MILERSKIVDVLTPADPSRFTPKEALSDTHLDTDLWEPKDHSKDINPYPTAFPYGNGMVLHFYQQQESSTTKTVHRVINKGLKTYV